MEKVLKNKYRHLKTFTYVDVFLLKGSDDNVK
nr:MAG TPA: hypothetical protein [Caudoviricetes sp.]